MEFKSNGKEYVLFLENDPLSEQLRISSFKDGIEERVEVWTTYKESKDSERDALPKRGDVEFAHISHLKFDWGDRGQSVQTIGNLEAVSKIKTFLGELKGDPTPKS